MFFANQSFSQEEQKQSTTGQVVSDERLLALLQASTDIFWILTPEGMLEEIPLAWLTFTGQTANDARGRGWLNALHPADQLQIEATLARTITSGQNTEITCHIHRYDGSYRLVRVWAIPVRTTGGEIHEVIVCGTEITNQDFNEQMSNAQIQLALKASGVGIWDRNLHTDQLVWSDQQKALFGWPPETPLSYERFLNAVHPEDRVRVEDLVAYCLAEPTDYNTEYRVVWPDGSVHWMAARARAIRDATGKAHHLVGATMDVTELKNVEAVLRENDIRLRQFVDSNIIGITIADLDGHILEANDAFLSLVGYTREDVTEGRGNWIAMTPPEQLTLDIQAIKDLLATGAFRPFEKEFLTKDGRRVPVLLGGTLFPQKTHEQLTINFVLDLTTRKKIEQQKDLFLGMTSHELKTPLAALKGKLQLMQRRLQSMRAREDPISPQWSAFFEDLTRHLATSVKQVDMQNRLINDLLDVSRITTNTLKLMLEHCDLVMIVRETVENLRVTAPERALQLILPERTRVYVLVDLDRISQVVTNYVTNALRYSSPDQPVQIGLTVLGDHARVWVRDRGPGLTVAARQELWQRFHQVKDIPVQSGSGKGLGLGLYISQTLIQQHRGEVGVESTPGEGSTFWFTLPIIT